MLLSPEQLKPFWMMLTVAWEQHCREHGVDHTDTNLKDAWRRDQVRKSTGKSSLTQVPRVGRKFIQLMADLEVITRSGITWQVKLHGAEKRPIIHTILEICREHDLDEHYMRGVARQALRLEALPQLEQLEVAQLLTVLQLLRMNVARMALAQYGGNA
ncbi:MAG TPA: hypothetical protein VF614_15690 [Chthoniobacteraceae bacterium]|jgi:hypothetical protein